MRRHFARIHVAALIAGLVAVSPAAATAATAPTIAILDFEALPSGRMLPPPQLGATAAQLMLDKLVTSGRYHVLDAHWLYTGRRLPPQHALAEIRVAAQEAGADYLVLGTITRFSEEHRNRGGGGAVFPFPILGGLRKQRTELVIDVTVRLVDTRTGEVVASATGNGIANRTNVSVGGLGLARTAGAAGGYSRGSTDFRDAQLAEAIERSIAAAAAAIANAAPKLTRSE